MNYEQLIGRIGNTLYINLEGPRIIFRVEYNGKENEYIVEYSNMYFIELAVYGESQYAEQTPITDADKEVYTNRRI